jgi:hypothetical protein
MQVRLCHEEQVMKDDAIKLLCYLLFYPLSLSLYINSNTYFYRIVYHPTISEGFDPCTTSSQQMHNNPSHEGGPHAFVVLML